jgi:hypothetical protein
LFDDTLDGLDGFDIIVSSIVDFLRDIQIVEIVIYSPAYSSRVSSSGGGKVVVVVEVVVVVVETGETRDKMTKDDKLVTSRRSRRDNRPKRRKNLPIRWMLLQGADAGNVPPPLRAAMATPKRVNRVARMVDFIMLLIGFWNVY